MKNKIVGIIIFMLLIGTNGIVLADWEPNDGHKMHYPQTLKPNFYDINFKDWYLGDDWQCSETGPVSEIHFWIAWRQDISTDLDFIKVYIYSDEPGGLYSHPKDMLWSRTFYPNDFTIAGPWTEDRGWYTPGVGYIENDHTKYYQINIKGIDDPFIQQQNVIYWLVIQMPYMYPIEVGWCSTKDFFNSYAVRGNPSQWWNLIDPIYAFEFSFVINNKEAGPDLRCNGSLSWTNVIPGSTVSGEFYVGNSGPTGSLLNWQVDSFPTWGIWTFSPSNGYGLPAGSWTTVTATCVTPTQKNTEFKGDILVENIDDPTDNCTIPIYLKTPITRDIQYQLLFKRLVERFPLIFLILQKLLIN
jgi:hypothetical protein